MGLTAVQVFEKTVYGSAKDILLENVNVFNGHSDGAIVLSEKSIQGDFEQTMDVILGGDIVKARNPYADTALTAKHFDRVKGNTVKLGLGTYPIEWTSAEFDWVLQNPAIAGVKIGRTIANQTMKLFAELAIGAVATCLNSNSKVKTEVPNGTKLSHLDLIKCMRPMGDQMSAVRLFVMHSSQYYDLLETTFKNAERLFDFAGITVMRNALGQKFLITDNSSLRTTSADYVLGLKKGSVMVGVESQMRSVFNSFGGNENIKHTFQSEWASALSVANYRYKTSDTMNGLSKSAITTASNWERINTTDPKAETGVIIACKKS